MNLTAYREGLEAGHEWESGDTNDLPENPYTIGTTPHDDWNRGFNHGIADEKDPTELIEPNKSL